MVTKILNIVMEINKLDDVDAFFEFSGHVNTLSITVLKECDWEEFNYKGDEESKLFERNNIYITEEQELKNTFNELAKLYGELKASK